MNSYNYVGGDPVNKRDTRGSIADEIDIKFKLQDLGKDVAQITDGRMSAASINAFKQIDQAEFYNLDFNRFLTDVNAPPSSACLSIFDCRGTHPMDNHSFRTVRDFAQGISDSAKYAWKYTKNCMKGRVNGREVAKAAAKTASLSATFGAAQGARRGSGAGPEGMAVGAAIGGTVGAVSGGVRGAVVSAVTQGCTNGNAQ